MEKHIGKNPNAWQILWKIGVWVAALLLLFLWPWKAEPVLSPVFLPFHKVLQLQQYGDLAVLSDLLHYLCPTIAVGIALHLTSVKSNSAFAAICGLFAAAALHVLSLMFHGGAFVLDALLYGAIGSVLGFTVLDLLFPHRSKIGRMAGIAVSLLVYIGLALLFIVDGGSATGRLTFAETAPLKVKWCGEELTYPNKAAYFEASGTYDYLFSGSSDETVNLCDLSDAELDALAKAELADCSNAHVRSLSARTLIPVQISVQDGAATLYYSTELNGAPVNGVELIVELNADGTLYRVRSTSEFDFREVGQVRLVSVEKAVQDVCRGRRGYTRFGIGQKILVEKAELRYFSNVDTGYYLPYWQFFGVNESGESVVLRIDAMR